MQLRSQRKNRKPNRLLTKHRLAIEPTLWPLRVFYGCALVSFELNRTCSVETK